MGLLPEGASVAGSIRFDGQEPVSYTHLRAHETVLDLVCRLLLEKKTEYNSLRMLAMIN